MPRKGFLVPFLLLAVLMALPAYAGEEEPPPMELLEFLAEFETEGGEWVDPTDIDTLDIPEQEQTNDAE